MYCIGIPDRRLYITEVAEVICEYSETDHIINKTISMVICDSDSNFTIYNSFEGAKGSLEYIKENKDNITFTDNSFCPEILGDDNEYDVEELEICQVTINKMTINPENS